MTNQTICVRLFSLPLIACSVSFIIGCKNPIVIQPSCPSTLEVGESGDVFGNVENPGEAARYTWTSIPGDAGSFDDASNVDAVFTALKPGTVFVQLAASDGLYEVISQCTTIIVPSADVLVQFVADPTAADTGQSVTLTCTDIGSPEVVEFEVTQTDGASVDLSVSDFGVFVFDAPDVADDLEFECVGLDVDDNESVARVVTVTVVDPAGGA